MQKSSIVAISIIFLISSIQCAYQIIDKEIFYNEQKSVKKGITYYNEVIDNLKQILKYYVYIDLFKNPPQPSFDNDYHPKIDSFTILEQIRSNLSENTNYYDFFRSIRKFIDSYRDAHMSYGLRGFNFKYIFLCPLKLTTSKNENGDKYMIGDIAFNNQDYFFNGTEVFKIIEANKNIPIKKINGKSPFEFMQNFGGDFFNLKNKQATYAFKTHQYMTAYAIYFPFDEDEIGLEVEYENGISFHTEYAIAETVNNENNLNTQKNLFYFYDDKELDKEFMNYMKNYIDNNNGYMKSLNELLYDFEKFKGIMNQNNLMNKLKFNPNNMLTESESANMKWDYEYISGGTPSFQCRVDNEFLLNVIHMPTFDFKNVTLIRDLIKDCVKLFDENDYKIVVILNFNGGGIELVAQTLVECIQPYITSRFYSTFLQGEYLDKYYSINDNFSDFSIVETCEVPDKKYLLEKSMLIDYGQNVTINVTLPLRRFGQYRKEFNAFKESLKNKRKPNDILIFTDGYSASSASLFTKSLQNEGGAIVIGYNGNPVSDYIFDSSQHFSSVYNSASLKQLDEELDTKMKNTGIYFSQICRTSNFFDYEEPKVPEEFNVKEVDEVADIYEIYNEENNYNLFMQKAKEIFEKYETKCSTKNSRLTKLDSTCSFENDRYAHGGHPCNEEGEWETTKCIKVYCDEGYFLNYKDNNCVKDPCISTEDPSDKSDENSIGTKIKINKIIIFVISLVLLS